MAHVSIYLNFMGNAEEAFNTYKRIFKSEFSTPMMRMGDMPPQPGMQELSAADKQKIMHVALPILGGTQIMATDVLEAFGQKLVEGNNVTISLNPDTKEEADRLYKELAEGGADRRRVRIRQVRPSVAVPGARAIGPCPGAGTVGGRRSRYTFAARRGIARLGSGNHPRPARGSWHGHPRGPLRGECRPGSARRAGRR